MGPELYTASKVAGLVLAGGVAVAPMAQTVLDEFGSTATNISVVAVLAALVGRYTFKQLEGYRTDLSTARKRIDDLETDLHAAGQAKAVVDEKARSLEEENHRLKLWILAQGIDPDAHDQ